MQQENIVSHAPPTPPGPGGSLSFSLSFFRQGCGQGKFPSFSLSLSLSLSSSPGHEGSVKPPGQLAPQLLLRLSEGVRNLQFILVFSGVCNYGPYNA